MTVQRIRFAALSAVAGVVILVGSSIASAQAPATAPLARQGKGHTVPSVFRLCQSHPGSKHTFSVRGYLFTNLTASPPPVSGAGRRPPVLIGYLFGHRRDLTRRTASFVVLEERASRRVAISITGAGVPHVSVHGALTCAARPRSTHAKAVILIDRFKQLR